MIICEKEAEVGGVLKSEQALPFKHELSVVEFSYPLTWITATVLFAIYYTKGGWMQRCIAAQNAKTQG